jgi:hypothetical protein
MTDHSDGMYLELLAHKKKSIPVEDREPSDLRRVYVRNNNSQYVDINGGTDHRIRSSNSIHPLSMEECDVYGSLLDTCDDGIVTPCINHNLNEDGNVEGFRFTCSSHNPARCLPVNRRMFFRTSMVECNTSDDRVERGHNSVALSMLLEHEKVLAKLTDVVQKMHQKSVGNEASFEHMPDNLDSVHTSHNVYGGQSEPLLGSFMCRRAADCRDWSPEIPDFVGIFHAYTR